MLFEVKVPLLPESVLEATVVAFHKKVGDKVICSENIVDLETDKIILEVPSSVDGILRKICFSIGDKVKSNDLLAYIEISDMNHQSFLDNTRELTEKIKEDYDIKADKILDKTSKNIMSPSQRRLIKIKGLSSNDVYHLDNQSFFKKNNIYYNKYKENSFKEKNKNCANDVDINSLLLNKSEEIRVPMNSIRSKIAERLLYVKNNSAMLTTFNEINLDAIVNLRNKYKESFKRKYNVKLGLISLFVKAVVESLKKYPIINAFIDGNDIVYHNYYNIGVAISSKRGLVVPVLRNVDKMNIADIENTMKDYVNKVMENKLTIEEMNGGTFTITNGGVFGSLLSTPIINPPQSGILGMHKIEDRPIVEYGKIVIKPMMYVAFSYDHRLIDGKDSIQFVLSIKKFLEDPACLLLEI
ncbi:dihydrolipoyllysine-residue succinyltransferase [Candidatus Legionella polyplacis]|uniref:dihydrolipoyllysine-residue succinyltransferase n=1 Tax=Candidatus Legionella polyplacis TaxID=2005262 RepID=UPI000C1E94D7|nr:dihydrolipoyllysine-residue succinyltransferase [Candidatus Legionella polyplacis]ATW01912.1 dihydrolipoyllysine-residue succinyltransferase [Candidatus Legionella polyplacis]